MPSKPPYVKTARRQSAQLTETVDLTNYSADDTDRTQTWTATSDSPHNIPASPVDTRGFPRVVDTVRESGDAEIDGNLWIADDADGVANLRGGGGKGASRIDTDQDGTDDWRIVVSHDEGGGLLRLDVQRID